MDLIGDIWNFAIVAPMINGLVLLYYIFFDNFGLSIIVFTVVVRAAMIPLTMKQSRQMKAMSRLQPKLNAIRARYPNDKQRAQQESMRIFKEEGVNPLGCLGPMIIQMPIFFGLFWALRGTLTSTPERLADLSRHLYSWLPQVNGAVPLDSTFIGLDLAKFSKDNPIPFLLPVLVGGSMWALQKMTAMPSSSAQQESTNKMMLWMMPLMFGFFTLNFEAGLALYWIMSNVVGLVIQGFITGWGPLTSLYTARQQHGAVEAQELVPQAEETKDNEVDRDDGQNSRRSHRNRPKGARRRAPRRRNRRR